MNNFYKKSLPDKGNAKGKRGFTLIELLVVIAIIGILGSIVLSSVSSANAEAHDVSIKANLASIKTSAELYYGSHNNYGVISGGTCATDEIFLYAPVANALKVADDSSDGSPLCVTGYNLSDDTIATSWAVSVPLKSDPSKYWCVDSHGMSKIGSESRNPNGEAYCS